jgi:hypothetical protein
VAKFKQGFYKVINEEKYIGKLDKVYYRSSWELQYMRWLDINKSVLKWSSEEIIIPYIKPTDNKPHRYYPDFYQEVITRTGPKKFLIEIKPMKDTELAKSKTNTPKAQRRLAESAITMEINRAKWEAAKEFCIKNNITFMVLTEKELFGK